MPVRVKIAQHAANLCRAPPSPTAASNIQTLFEESCPNEWEQCQEIIQSSFHLDPDADDPVHASSNGFINGAVMAYSWHHHLVIRPDDIWVAILTQLSIYINKHAKELRGKFVAHDGKKELEVRIDGIRFTVDDSRFSVEYGFIAEKMTHLLQENVVDPELRAWVMPAFTTTDKTDEVVASILMMGTLQKYFDFKARYLCGIPSVELLGEQADWEEILKRVEKLQTFGEESTQWYRLLKPVLSRFVATFDTPQAPEISDFWARMINRHESSGVDEVNGWLSAFCFWKEDGVMLYQPPPARATSASRRGTDLCLDGQTYGKFDMDDVPRGYATVPIKCNDDGFEFDAVMLAGFVGIKCSSSGESTAHGEIGLDTVQAKSGWVMFEKKIFIEE